MSTDLHDDLLTAEQCYRDAIRAQSDDAFEQACRCLSRGLQLIAFLQDDVAQGLRIAMNACMGSICVRLGRWHTADLHLHTSLSAARLTGDRPATPCVRIDVAFIRERKTRGRERLVNETFTGIEREGNEESVGRNEVTGVGRGGIWNWSFDDPELVTSRSKSGSERGGETREAP